MKYRQGRCYCRQNDFTVTCGRAGVGSITSIDLRLDGSDKWRLSWIDISDGSETIRFEMNDWFDDYETRRLQRG